MKHPNTKTLSLLLAAGFLAGGVAHADVVGDQSQNNISAGVSTVNGGPHHAGLPGIGVPSTGKDNRVDFAGLTQYGVTDSHGVTTLNFASPTPPPGSPPDHSNLGYFHFAKVANANVYYGEWSQTTSASDGTHAAYYAGDTAGTTVPASGTASYTVQGVSDYANKGALSGTFNANFGNRTLTGSLANAAASYTVNIGTASINAANATFAGANATATGAGTGSVSGRFFGANAAALAGIATFGNHQYDTAFGGTKN